MLGLYLKEEQAYCAMCKCDRSSMRGWSIHIEYSDFNRLSVCVCL